MKTSFQKYCVTERVIIRNLILYRDLKKLISRVLNLYGTGRVQFINFNYIPDDTHQRKTRQWPISIV